MSFLDQARKECFGRRDLGGGVLDLELVDEWSLGLLSGDGEVEWGGGMGFARFVVVDISERNLY